jgi:hypothetical protein
MVVLVASCNSANKDRPSSNYEQKKSELSGEEKESPTKFLKVSGTYRGNLIGQTVVEGEIENKSTLTAYKDIQVQVTFKDKEGGTIEKQKHTINETVKSGSSSDFKIKVKHVKEVASVTIDIVDAIADK